VLIPVAVYLWAAPTLAERALTQASLPELIADSQRDPNNPRVFHYLGLRYQAAGELEQALAVSLLAAADHSQQALLGQRGGGAAPWQVRRAEDYIEAHWNRPISIEDLAAVTGTSARSLFRRFKEYRGCSPLDFAKRLRLRHAHRMLRAGDPGVSVTQVATECGFGDLGHFGKDYAKAFGELPSQTLQHGRQTKLAPPTLAPSALAPSTLAPGSAGARRLGHRLPGRTSAAA